VYNHFWIYLGLSSWSALDVERSMVSCLVIWYLQWSIQFFWRLQIF